MLNRIFILDLDGSVADCEHRRHHLLTNDWKSFFDGMVNDLCVEPVADIARQYYHNSDVKVFICSGRPDNYERETREWLKDMDVPYHELHMRVAGDMRSDVIVKREMLQSFRNRDLDVLFCIDDRRSVVDYWRSEGLVCLQAAPGFDEKVKYPSGELTLLIGPSGAGKSTYAKNLDGVVSSDKIRQELCGDFKDQSKNEQVFSALHSIVKARLESGLNVVVDATNIRARDRRNLRDIAGPDTSIFYYVISRPIEERKRDGGWRNEVMIKDLTLIEKHDEVFKANLKSILNGDGDSRVTVKDLRT